MRRTALLAALFGLCAPAAFAEKACFVSYSGFEEKVAHLDIETCPGAPMKAEEGLSKPSSRDMNFHSLGREGKGFRGNGVV